MPIITISAAVIAARTFVEALSVVAMFAFHLSGSNFPNENSPVLPAGS